MDRKHPAGLEDADRALAEGRVEDALRGYLEHLIADPADRYCWLRLAELLSGLLPAPQGVATLEQAAEGLAERGDLLLAIAAAAMLDARDDAAADRARNAIAALYGRGSPRVERGHRASPPPPPQGARGAGGARLAEADLRVLTTEAADACERARSAVQPGGALPHHPLLCELEARELREILPLVRLREGRVAEAVIAQGTEGTSFFLVAHGVVRAERDGVLLARLGRGAFFGEMALLTDAPRIASVICVTPTLLLELERDAVERLAGQSPGVGRVLADHTRRRLLRNLLATSPIFAMLDVPRRETLIELFSPQVFGPGEVVVAEGADAGGLHVVLSGAVQVTKREDGETLALAELGPGGIIGEISLLDGVPATATVAAVGKTVMLRLPRGSFEERGAEFPEVLAHLRALGQERQEIARQAAQESAVPVDPELIVL